MKWFSFILLLQVCFSCVGQKDSSSDIRNTLKKQLNDEWVSSCYDSSSIYYETTLQTGINVNVVKISDCFEPSEENASILLIVGEEILFFEESELPENFEIVYESQEKQFLGFKHYSSISGYEQYFFIDEVDGYVYGSPKFFQNEEVYFKDSSLKDGKLLVKDDSTAFPNEMLLVKIEPVSSR